MRGQEGKAVIMHSTREEPGSGMNEIRQQQRGKTAKQHGLFCF